MRVCVYVRSRVLDPCAEIHNLELKDIHEIDEALFLKSPLLTSTKLKTLRFRVQVSIDWQHYERVKTEI